LRFEVIFLVPVQCGAHSIRLFLSLDLAIFFSKSNRDIFEINIFVNAASNGELLVGKSWFLNDVLLNNAKSVLLHTHAFQYVYKIYSRL